VQGSLVGALLVGIIDTFSRVYFPAIAQYTMYLVLILRLSGEAPDFWVGSCDKKVVE
jgi:hypothetical protein